MQLIGYSRKKSVFLIAFLFISLTIQAQTTRKQDVIMLRDSTKLEVFIQEVNAQTIKYRKISDPDGPLFNIKKEDIRSIQYGNGEEETFEAAVEVQGYYSDQKTAVSPVTPAAPMTGNRFESKTRKSSPDHLRKTYNFYKSKSKNGMAMGIAGIAGGMLMAGIGTGMVAGSTDANGNFATIQDQQRAINGAWLMVGGFAGAVTFGTVGFVKMGKNGSKANRAKRELMQRGEPLTMRIAPRVDPVNKAAYLGLKVTF